MAFTSPFFEVMSHETGLPVSIVAWHVRSVRPIREQVNDGDTITRIEFTNGDVLDAMDTVTEVVARLRDAVSECLDSVRVSAFQRTD
jgi:hypothetical protein